MKKILVILIIILTVALVVLGGLLYFVYRPFSNEKNTAPPEDKPVEMGIIYYPDDVFLTNLKDSDYILKSDIVIEVEDNATKKILENNTPRIRDRIIKILRSVTENDVSREDIQDILKTRIKDDLQKALNIDKIIDVYFNEFVVQQ